MMIREGLSERWFMSDGQTNGKKKLPRHVCKREASFAGSRVCTIMVMIIYLCFSSSTRPLGERHRALIVFLLRHFPHNFLWEATTNRHPAPKHYQFLFANLPHIPPTRWIRIINKKFICAPSHRVVLPVPPTPEKWWGGDLFKKIIIIHRLEEFCVDFEDDSNKKKKKKSRAWATLDDDEGDLSR